MNWAGWSIGLILILITIVMYIIGDMLCGLLCLLTGMLVLLFSVPFEKAVRIPLLLLLLRAVLFVVWG